MKKFLSILLVLMLGIGILSGCKGEERQSDAAHKETTEKSKNEIPTIKGSNSEEVLLAMKKMGFPEAKGHVTDTGIIYQETNGIYSYDMDIVHKSNEISFINFIVTKDKKGKEILPVFATLVHSEDISQEKAEKWVKNNIGKKTKKTFGNTTFSIYQTNTSYILEIKNKDYEDVVKYNL